MSATVLDMTATTDPRPTIATMANAARAILRARGVDPDGLGDQGQIADDLGVRRRTISDLRLQYQGPPPPGTERAASARGLGRNGPFAATGDDAVEAFPAPTRYIGKSPVWEPRWVALAWSLTRERSRARLTPNERTLLDAEEGDRS